MSHISSYKVGVIKSLEDCGNCSKSKGKSLRKCDIQVSPNDDDDLITVVTSATNVREGSRIVVAPVGSFFIGSNDGSDDLLEVKKATVGGVISEGMLCDSVMLGWIGGAKGIAVQIPDTFEIGSAPPVTKPRMDNKKKESDSNNLPKVEVKGLFEKKLTKEEKKALAAERKAKRKAAKKASEES